MVDNIPENTVSGKSAVTVSLYIRNGLLIIFGALLIAALYAMISLAKSPEITDQGLDRNLLNHALYVNVMTLKAVSHYQIKQKYSGTITARRESDYGFDSGGILAQVLVKNGDRVKKGDILARLDRRRLDARAQELKADLARAVALNHETTARLDRARATYDRYRALVAQNNISKQRFDQAKFNLIALKAHKVSTGAGVWRAKAALNSLKIALDMTILKARFDGSIVRRYRDEGAAVTAGTPIVRLIEDQNLEIHVGLPLSALASFTVGKQYIFDYQGKKITTFLRAVLKNMNVATRTVTAIFNVINAGSNVRSGALARLTVTTDIKQTGFWIPTAALAEGRRGLWSAYTLKPYKGSAEYSTLSRQELQLLYTDSTRVFVRGTLQNGD
ncbi:MAG: efflux RND transporter periplasmic adaptor subunit, partial [Alphaproteobacteria bacterium]|nr:efflux RND transporter periplasmic adaptor subunit [Alphaproteobacteria bacterium]